MKQTSEEIKLRIERLEFEIEYLKGKGNIGYGARAIARERRRYEKELQSLKNPLVTNGQEKIKQGGKK